MNRKRQIRRQKIKSNTSRSIGYRKKYREREREKGREGKKERERKRKRERERERKEEREREFYPRDMSSDDST